MREGFAGRWIDVYENPGKRSGAYSAPVYGVHPYMLLNWNDTLDAVFTLAHEMGHSMHTLLAHEHQPFIYSNYTIFVAEVPSTLSEALSARSPAATRRRIHASARCCCSTPSTDRRHVLPQVMFADFELRAHRLVEADAAITADALGDVVSACSRPSTATPWTTTSCRA